MIEKLTVKDLINIGIFSAMYIVTMMVIVTVFGSVPILYLIVPLPVGIGCAVVYSLLVMRVPKKRSSASFINTVVGYVCCNKLDSCTILNFLWIDC